MPTMRTQARPAYSCNSTQAQQALQDVRDREPSPAAASVLCFGICFSVERSGKATARSGANAF